MSQYASLTVLIPHFAAVSNRSEKAPRNEERDAQQPHDSHTSGHAHVDRTPRTPGYPTHDEPTNQLVQDWLRALYDAWDVTTCYNVLGQRGIDPPKCLVTKSFSTLDTISVLALMTWITRGDCFTSGFIEDHIEDGSILALLQRLADLDGVTAK